MFYCPLYDTWVHECQDKEHKECWDLHNWDACRILRKEVEDAEKYLLESMQVRRF